MKNSGLGKTPLITLALIIIVSAVLIQQVHAVPSTLTGTITDETGNPIPDAGLNILVRRSSRYWSSSWTNYKTTTTDANGQYNVNLETGQNYLILITHTNTAGEYDYLPYSLYQSPTTEEAEKNIQLWKTATINLEGLAYFIETTAIPDNTFRLINPESTEIIRYGDLGLVYGPGSGSISSLLNMPSNKVYVPADRYFKLEVQSSAKHNNANIHKVLTVNDYTTSKLAPGESATIDLRSLSLPASIKQLENQTETIEALINEKEAQGFFLAVERQQLSGIRQTTNAAVSLLEQGRYEEAFTKSRETFVLIMDLTNGLDNMLSDASNSVYILVGFIGLTSIIVASLLYEEPIKKMTVSLLVFGVLLIALIVLHPGAQIATTTELVKVSATALVSVNLVALILPRFMNRSSTGKDVSLLNMTVPIFSIAKRSLRRRRLRFMLTLTSVLLLVASFISLTSFTSGYGLSFTKTHDSVLKNGVMIRTPDPPPERAAAPFSGGTGVAGPLPLDESMLEWYSQIGEVSDVIPIYMNQPQRQYRESNRPIGRIGRTPIFGIVGIVPQMEAAVNHLDTALVEGSYIGDEPNTVMISVGLAAKLGLTVGDSFSMTSQEKTHELTIVGLLDDDTLEKLTDIDGKPLLPNKIIEVERVEADGPDFVVEALSPCRPDEVVWVSDETGSDMSALQLLRINLLLQEDVNAQEYARATALDRGFRAWASTSTGVYLAELTGYFEGKGLPIVIPWLIVVLNVVVTMMNAYYERRHEVMIYSSIGMNPRHISSIFLAEAAVIGVLGGCVGYLFGLGAYKLIYILTPALQVKQKISAVWSFAAIGISMMAVIIGGLSALKNSTSITPSLQRRWVIDKKQESTDETRIVIPIQVYEEEIGEYIDFLDTKLEQGRKGHLMMVRMPKKTQTGEHSWEYRFIYSSSDPQISPLYTRNRLTVEKNGENTYTTILFTRGESDSLKQAGSFLRQIGLDWSLQREKGEH